PAAWGASSTGACGFGSRGRPFMRGLGRRMGGPGTDPHRFRLRRHGWAMLRNDVPEVTIVSGTTPATAFTGLPVSARLAFAFAARLQRGTLEAILPDGRHFRFGGEEPGPAATVIVRDFGFARRLLGGGDIGIAEAYLRGEW